ncbi:MAG: hypothetical protein NZ534_00830, partial [Bacteroidia bacterium]|nr:hypothetical protein [Bacteroidia bacterium]
MSRKLFTNRAGAWAACAAICLCLWAGADSLFAREARWRVDCTLDVSITTPAPALICPGGSVVLNTSVSGEVGSVSYSWSPASGLSSPSSPNPTASPSVTTTYTVTATDAASCTDVAVITVYVAPAALHDFPVANGNVNAAVVIGNIAYVGGAFTQFGGLPRNRLAAVDLNTGQVTSWNPGANNVVLAMATDGVNIYVAGQFTGLGGNIRRRVGAVTPAGVVTSFDPDANSIVRAIAIAGSKAYIGGDFTDVGAATGKIRLAAVDKTTGAVDMAFTANPNNVVRALHVEGTTLYVGGDFTNIQSTVRNRAAAIDLTTGNLTSFNPNVTGGAASVRAIAYHGGFVYIGGDFTTVSSLSRPRLARLNPSTGAPTSFNPAPTSTVFDIHIAGNTLYLAGSFTQVFSTPRPNLAAINLATDALRPWNPTPDNNVFTVFDYGCRVFAGGAFSNIDSRSASNFAALNGGESTTISVSGPSFHCTGSPSTLTASGGTQYRWCNTGETTASITVNPVATTVYTVSAIVGGCVVTETFTLTVNTPTPPTITGDFEGCVGETLTLDAGPGYTSYQWYKDGNPLVGETNQTLNVTTGGVYQVQVSNGFCTTSDDVTVIFHPLPTVTASSPDLTICVGENTTLNASGAVSYVWTPGSLSGASVSVSPAVTTTYTVTGTDANGCQDTDEITVTVYPLPDPGIWYGGGDYICPGSFKTLYADPGYATYQWYKDGNLITGATAMTYNATTGGSYTVQVTDAAGCVGISSVPVVLLDPPPGVGVPLSGLPAVNGQVFALLRVGDILYIGGSFSDVGGQPRNNLAAVNLTDGSVTSWNPNANNQVFALEYNSDNGWIYIGGSFTQISSTPRNRAAAVTASGSLTGWNPNVNGNVRAIAFKGDTVFIGGQFTTVGGSNVNRRVAAVNRTTGVRYTGLTVDLSAGNVRALYADKKSNTLFIGGNFTSINGMTRNYLG